LPASVRCRALDRERNGSRCEIGRLGEVESGEGREHVQAFAHGVAVAVGPRCDVGDGAAVCHEVADGFEDAVAFVLSERGEWPEDCRNTAGRISTEICKVHSI
jgi:hypothetical protein